MCLDRRGIHVHIRAPRMFDKVFYVCRQQRVAWELRLHGLSEMTQTFPRRTTFWHPSPAARGWIAVAGDVAVGVGAIAIGTCFDFATSLADACTTDTSAPRPWAQTGWDYGQVAAHAERGCQDWRMRACAAQGESLETLWGKFIIHFPFLPFTYLG